MAVHDSSPVIAVSPDEAARALGIGRTLAYQLLASGELPSLTIGRRRLVRVADIERFAAARAVGER